MRRFGKRSFCRFTAASSTAELFIYDFIGGGMFGEGVTAQQVADALRDAEGAAELRIFINSPGGNVFEGAAIYNQIVRFPGRKTVFVDGVAASMASVIALAGDRIITAPNAMWMIHEPSGGCFGTIAEMERTLEAAKSIRSLMVDTYQKRTKQKREDIEAWMAATTYMDATTAKARGFTDEVGEEPRERAAQACASDPTLEDGYLKFLGAFPNAPKALPAMARAQLPLQLPPPQKENTMDRNLLIALLGLQASATDADIQAAITKLIEGGRGFTALSDSNGKLLAATGKGTVDDALGVIAGWKAGAARAEELTKELAAIREAAEKTERDALVATALKDGKLVPAMKGWAETQSLATLKAYLEVAPKAAVAEPAPGEKPAPKGGAAPVDPATMTATQKDVFKQLGVEPKPKEAGK